MWWVVWLQLALSPSRLDVEPWLGHYVAGPETIAFCWHEGLVYHHGNVVIPVDGEWHVTVPEFYVRHRVTWLDGRDTLRLEESHDASQAWRHELRREGTQIVKVSLTGGTDGKETVVRTFEKAKEGAPCARP